MTDFLLWDSRAGCIGYWGSCGRRIQCTVRTLLLKLVSHFRGLKHWFWCAWTVTAFIFAVSARSFLNGGPRTRAIRSGGSPRTRPWLYKKDTEMKTALSMISTPVYAHRTIQSQLRNALLRSNRANTVKEQVSVLPQNLCDAGDCDFVIVHQNPLQEDRLA